METRTVAEWLALREHLLQGAKALKAEHMRLRHFAKVIHRAARDVPETERVSLDFNNRVDIHKQPLSSALWVDMKEEHRLAHYDRLMQQTPKPGTRHQPLANGD